MSTRVALVASLVFATGGLVSAADASGPTVAFANAAGINVLGVSRLDQRDFNVAVFSPDLGRRVDIRILVPADYFTNERTRYPVLYLFHGTSGRASDWINQGGAEQTTAPYDVITVMPDVGFDGDGGFWFTNWVNRYTRHGPSQFEDYLIDSLVPWIDFNLRTIASRNGRAVAGLSQGGYGAAEMASRHPDMFVSMASFSGAPEIERDPQIFAGSVPAIEAIEVGLDQVPPFSELGNPVTDLINWQGHDPATLVSNLRGMSIYLWSGTGQDGPYDPTPNPFASLIEAGAYESTQAFYGHLSAQGIPAYFDGYVYGTHSFPYWARDLRQFVPMMMRDFAHPRVPTSASYTSIDETWTQWGYTVAFDRAAPQEFSSLSEGNAGGFIIRGTGTATITTPPDYRPGSPVEATTVEAGRQLTENLVAAPSGRVTIGVSLGSGWTHQADVTIRSGS